MNVSSDLDSLLRATRPLLVRFLTRMVGQADAEDVTQIVLSKAAGAFTSFRGDASPRTWLFKIATNAALDWRRTRHLGSEDIDLVAEAEDLADVNEDASQERRLIREQMGECVSEILHRLPESYRTVLALSDCEEVSDKSIASILGVTVGAAKIRLHRARTRLKEELELDCSFYRDDRNVLCCDRKESAEHAAYRFGDTARLQVGNREVADPSRNLNEEETMTAVEILLTKQKDLIGVGASIAAGCQPCTLSFAAAAREAGACGRGIRLAVESGLAGRESATAGMSAFASTELANPELDAAFRAERVLLDALIRVAAAIAGNMASLVTSEVEHARALGASDDQIRVAADIARTARHGSERETENALRGMLEGTGEPACRSDRGSEPAACGCGSNDTISPAFETVHIEKTKNTCSLCEDYAKEQAHKPIVVMSCEGACLRGEISRQAANHLCNILAPDKTARLCLGAAFTKDAGQRALVRGAQKVVALEGCLIRCASRMMRGHIPDLEPEVILTDSLCEFDRSLFGVEALPTEAVQMLGRAVAAKVVARL